MWYEMSLSTQRTVLFEYNVAILREGVFLKEIGVGLTLGIEILQEKIVSVTLIILSLLTRPPCMPRFAE